jgi:hypothetical protein
LLFEPWICRASGRNRVRRRIFRRTQLWQRNVFAPRASEILELHASHSPFLSQPAAVADLLAERAGAKV